MKTAFSLLVGLLLVTGGSLAARDEQEKSGTGRPWIDDRVSGKIPLFYLTPGLMSSVVDVAFQESNGNRIAMTDLPRSHPALDIGFPELQLGETFGTGFVLHSASFNLNRQFVQPGHEDPLRDSIAKYTEGERAARGPGRELGTRLRGFYSIFVPFMYYGKPGQENFRLGGGLGVGVTHMSGTASLENHFARYYAIDALMSEDQARIRVLRDYHLFSNALVDPRSMDPISLYLIWNADRGDNLERLGIYWQLTGRSSPGVTDYAYMRFFSGSKTEGELAGLYGFSRGFISIRSPLAPAYLLFADSPSFWGGFKLRFAVQGLTFQRGDYNVNVDVASFAVYYPIPVRMPSL